MSHEVVRRVEELAAKFAAASDATERGGTLSDESVALVREAGVMRLLQPAEFGGYAAHPRDFAEAVMAVARRCGSTGWVCGVGGVHPWEMALLDHRVQEELWGENPDSWMASPYAPQGTATITDGGYTVTGHWNFSSGTDHCDWVVLGALVVNPDGKPAGKMIHIVVPRKDYTIIDDSWDVVGLCGTGSKDVVIDGAYVPGYRTIDATEVAEGEAAAERAGRTETLYKLPFWTMFPLGITSAVIGICEGALDAHFDYQRNRTTAYGTRAKDDPYVLSAVSEAASDIAASRTQLIDGVSRLYDKIEAGTPVTFEDRSLVRRNQVRSAWRAVSAVDEIFSRSGGNAARKRTPLQRFWRDAHVGLQHAIHTPGPLYHSSALTAMGFEPEGSLRGQI